LIHTIWIDSTAMTGTDIELAAKDNGKINSFKADAQKIAICF